MGGKMRMRKVAEVSLKEAQEWLGLSEEMYPIWIEEFGKGEKVESLRYEYNDGNCIRSGEATLNLDIPCQILVYEEEG